MAASALFRRFLDPLASARRRRWLEGKVANGLPWIDGRIVIDEPGTYLLDRDMDVPADVAIQIHRENVVLDLNGHSIRKQGGHKDESIGILVLAQRNVTIRGGRITGFRHGIVSSQCRDAQIVGVDVSGCLKLGMTVGGDGAQVIGCVADGIAGAPDEAYAVGINIVGGEDVRVEHCRISNVYRQAGADPQATGEGCGIICGARVVSSRIRSNVIVNDRAEPKTIGIFGGGGGTHLLENNLIRNFHNGVQGGGTPANPTNALRNAIWIERPLPRSEGLSVVYGRVEGNLVAGFAKSGRHPQEKALNTVFDGQESAMDAVENSPA